MKKFAIIGIAGFVAPKHLQAIKNIGGEVLAAHDISDAVGILDAYFPDCEFFTTITDFRQCVQQHKIDYLVVCTPNYLHVEHCILGLQLGLDVVCEKPLVLSIQDLTLLKEKELLYNKKIYTILQLRLHEQIKTIKQSIEEGVFYKGTLTYFTPRGNWYHQSWKGIEEKSGGIATNIGVHFFDMLSWCFGNVNRMEIIESHSKKSEGILFFNQAEIHWDLSIDRNLPPTRSIILNDKAYIFTDGFHHLHVACYQHILEGNGFGIDENFGSTEIIETIRNMISYQK
jgi:UDP-N-acetyl-2-amino-2-deoxyglucuronate dehydrogenase